MKKIILLLAISATYVTANAQSTKPHLPKKDKVNYSFAWGLFKSKDYSAVFELEKPKSSTSSAIDTAKYDQKSILWGTIQWTEKKKSISPLKCQKNEQ